MFSGTGNRLGQEDGGIKYYWRLIVLVEILILLIALLCLMHTPQTASFSHSRLHASLQIHAQTYGGDPTIRHPDPKIEQLLKALNFSIDPRLESTARAVVTHIPNADAMLSLESLNYYLNASGAVYWDTEQIFLETEETDDLKVYEKLLTTQGRTVSDFGARIGFAEQWSVFPTLKRKIIALVAHPRFILSPLARHVTPGVAFELTGRIASRIRDVSVMTLNEHGHQRTIPGKIINGQLSAPLSLTPGRWTIEVVGDTPLGPLPLAQLKLCAGCLSSSVFRESNPPKDKINQSPVTQLLSLINESRTESGLTAMVHNPALAAVASAHSNDMVIHKFVGHRSPTTGDVEQRLKRANLSPIIFGENIAKNTSIADVHRSLMHSISHRLNILEPAFTDIGLGIERVDGHWIVTEVFARLDQQFTQL